MISIIDIVNLVDTFSDDSAGFYWKLISTCGTSLGFMVPEIAKRFLVGNQSNFFELDFKKKQVKICEGLDTLEKRNNAFAEVALAWRSNDDKLRKGWRDELYTVYCPQSTPYIQMERAFACLLGVVTYGVHIIGFIPPENNSDNVLKIWVPRRSETKQTYPGKLDNTIAGGLAFPYSISENAVKECYEEGGFTEEFVKKNLRPAGVISYICQPFGNRSYVQPEVEYICDLTFESEVENIPRPIDGEAEDYQLMPISEVYTRILNYEFKPNCALVLIDFMIRHGFLTWENEPNYLEIVSRIHRRMPFPTLN